VPKILKVIAYASLRLFWGALSLYVIVGCILFPLWWKTFFFGGGFFKVYYWKYAFSYLGEEFKTFSALAVLLTVGVLSVITYMIYWLGKYSDVNEAKKLVFFKKLPPPWWIVTGLLITAGLMIFSVSWQPGYFDKSLGIEVAANRTADRMLQAVGDLTKAFTGLKTESEFAPPNSGVYIYLDEKLLVRQFQALQQTLEIKSTSESVLGETNVSASVSLPVNSGGIGLSEKTAAEKSVVKSAPEISASFAATELIKRFDGLTNTLKWGVINAFGTGSSDIFVAVLEKRGLKFTGEQLEQLHIADKKNYENDLKAVTSRQIVFYDGVATIKKDGAKFWLEINRDGPVKMTARGILHKESMQDSMIIARETEGQLGLIKMMLFLDTVERNQAGDFTFRFTPYVIW
jgi:hypothetical protein